MATITSFPCRLKVATISSPYAAFSRKTTLRCANVVIPITHLPWLFDRPINSAHTWYGALRADDSRTGPQEKAVRSNLAIDGRIDSVAETQLLSDFSAIPHMPAPILSIHEHVPDYFRHKYCKPYTDVKFLSSVVTVPAGRELLHVGSLRGLLGRVVKDARGRSLMTDHFKTTYGRNLIPVAGDLPWVNIALAMNSGGEVRFRQTIALIHSHLGANQPFWWATFFAEVRSFVDDAKKLANALGLGEYIDGDLLLTYQYRARDVGLLYRPTTIESNNYAFHYPSPATTATGMTMALAAGNGPCSEMIHHCPNAVLAGSIVDTRVLELNGVKQLVSQYDEVEACRTAHKAYLRRSHAGKDTSAEQWLERHKGRF